MNLEKPEGPQTVDQFITYVKGRQILPSDYYGGSKKGYASPSLYIEDFELIKASGLTAKEKLQVLNSMSGMMSVLGTDAVDRVSAYEEELEKEIVKQ